MRSSALPCSAMPSSPSPSPCWFWTSGCPRSLRSNCVPSCQYWCSGYLPDFLSFVITFLVIGFYWLAHHRMFDYIVRHDGRFQWINLVFLMSVAFLPFPTSVLSDASTNIDLDDDLPSTTVVLRVGDPSGRRGFRCTLLRRQHPSYGVAVVRAVVVRDEQAPSGLGPTHASTRIVHFHVGADPAARLRAVHRHLVSKHRVRPALLALDTGDPRDLRPTSTPVAGIEQVRLGTLEPGRSSDRH